LTETSTVAAKSFKKTFGRRIVAMAGFIALVIVNAITQNANDQTARCPTISNAPAGSSSGQYRGNNPQST
jgi:hypothetical protein